MSKQTYSAGMVKYSFWFLEYKKLVNYYNQGLNIEEIKVKNKSENLVLASSEPRKIQIGNVVLKRIKSLDDSFHQLFEQSDISTQKLIVLISIMKTDILFDKFMQEVYCDHLILNEKILEDSSIQIFFKNKQMQDETVSRWTDITLNKLKTSYKAILTEAGLITYGVGNRNMLKPLISGELEHCLLKNNMTAYLYVLTGDLK